MFNRQDEINIARLLQAIVVDETDIDVPRQYELFSISRFHNIIITSCDSRFIVCYSMKSAGCTKKEG